MISSSKQDTYYSLLYKVNLCEICYYYNAMFRKGEKVVYPKHGAGKIISIYREKIEGKPKCYLRIKFFNSPATVSVPVEGAKRLGLRYPLSRVALKEALGNLNKKVKIGKDTLVTLDKISREKLNSGRIDDVIDLVNILRSLAKKKEEENKNFSYSYSDRLDIALDFIKSEAGLVLGKGVLKKYNLF